MSQSTLRLGVVGCGAVTQKGHLAAVAGCPGFQLTALVDRVGSQAASAARRYGELCAASGVQAGRLEISEALDRVLDVIDAAIVATPSATHASVAGALAEAGKHVLVEKPMALTSRECDELRAAAEASGVVVAPAHVRRFFPSTPFVKAVLEGGRLGPIRAVRWSQGGSYRWPVVTAFPFGPPAQGGGVLADMGPHAFDLLAYWFGPAGTVSCLVDNSEGGAESEVVVAMSFGGVPARIELSRLRTLGNGCSIDGEHGSLCVGLGRSARYARYDASSTLVGSGPVSDLLEGEPALERLLRRQLTEFGAAIAGLPSTLATFDDGTATVRIVEECRAARRGSALPRPWKPAGPLGRPPAAARVAVTGATGFVGSHVVERFLADAASPIAAVGVGHSVSGCARLSHLDPGRLHLRWGDIRDRALLAEAFAGCDVVVHTVYGNSGTDEQRWQVTVDGTAAALEEAVRAGVRRFVHASTMGVYRNVDGGSLDETGPPLEEVPGSASYGHQKLAAERLVMEAGASGELEVVVVQPTIVYGPWGPKWTVRPLTVLAQGDDTLPTGSDGATCNAVHVHDLAAAIVFLSCAPGLGGMRVLVSGPDTLRWGRFYDAYRDMLGVERRSRYAELERAGGAPELYRAQPVVDIARLRGLGFEPRVGFEEGMRQVRDWAVWAGLVPGRAEDGTISVAGRQ